MFVEELNDIFNEVYDQGALIIKPATQFELDRCQDDLKYINSPVLPEEYIEFLKIVNGFAWNGFEFFGTYQITVKKTGYMLVDIVTYNQDWRARKRGVGNRIALGRFDEDIYCYNYDLGKFESIDSLTLIQVEEYESFEELFVSTVTDYIDWDDEDEEDEYDGDTGDESTDDEAEKDADVDEDDGEETAGDMAGNEEDCLNFDVERYEKESRDPDFCAGQEAFNREDFRDARQLFEKAYERGNTLAGVRLGMIYYRGYGCDCDHEKAVRLFTEGEEQGCPLGSAWLAECYRMGKGMPKDEKKAKEIYDRCRGGLEAMCEAGSADACYAYGYDLMMGHYQPGDPGFENAPTPGQQRKGFLLLEKAAAQGNVNAIANVACALLNGLGCDRDEEKAADLLEPYADYENMNVHYWLGGIYYLGSGREQDFEKARRHFLIAAEQGDDGAQYFLGDFYSLGEAVEEDFAEAAKWYRLSAEQNNPFSAERLGSLYYEGKGVPRDLREAYRYCKIAADDGDASAAYTLARICILEEECRDGDTGLKYLEQAANGGNLAAQKLLAECYEGKYGFEKDDEKSRYWAMMAAGQEGSGEE